jgi:hypothetical protein
MSTRKTTSNTPNTGSNDRQARLGAALRANLRRRKEQSRAKSADSLDKSGDSPETPEVKEKS